MTRNRLAKLKAEHARLSRLRVAKSVDLVGLAISLGRKLVKRGKHPLYESVPFPNLHALSIPFHGGSGDLKTGTKNSILIQLEEDIAELELIELN
jgi:hypothetical protein